MATEREAPALPGWLRRLRGESGEKHGGEHGWRSMAEGMGLILCEAVTPDFTATYLSPAAESRFGWPVAVWSAGDIWEKLVHAEDLVRMMARLNAVAHGDVPCDEEFRAHTKGGESLVLRAFATALPDRDGRAGVRIALEDRTARRQAESESQRTEERVSSALDHAGVALLVHDRDGRIGEVNRVACEMLGYNRTELLGLRVADVQAHFDDAVKAMWTTLDPGRAQPTEVELRRRDGSTFAADLRTSALEWGGRAMLATVARDASARKRLEQQLRHSQKMEAVGRLAGGVAHDFNNLLTAIRGHADLIMQELAAQGQVRDDLAGITRAADRAATLTRKLLAFSRQQIFAPEVLDLNRIVVDISRLLRPLIGEHIELRTELDATHRIRADHGQIEQVLVNLVVNARDAMPQGGVLTLATSELLVDEEHPYQHGFVRPGGYVVLRVTDTGHGMDASTISRIFEPFFTTKEKGKGSGLGLAIAYGIVKQSGGYLIAESEPGRGATFLAILPRTDASAPEISMTTADLVPAGTIAAAGKTVLVIEDEAPVRALIARVLGRAGFRVLEAASGEDAQRRAQEHPAFDLILADVVLPDTDGRELARSLTAARPGCAVLLMSGYSDELPPSREAAMDAPLLHKPFTPAELTSRIRETLAV